MTPFAAGQPPQFRATVSRAGDVTLTPAAPQTAQPGGWTACGLVPPNVVGVFDIWIDRTTADGITVATDLTVADAFPGEDVEFGRRRLAQFAERLGYQRVWLDNEVVAIEPQLLGGTWKTCCGRCGLAWSDSSDGFWLHIRGAGFFPMLCTMCSHPLVQPIDDVALDGVLMSGPAVDEPTQLPLAGPRDRRGPMTPPNRAEDANGLLSTLIAGELTPEAAASALWTIAHSEDRFPLLREFRELAITREVLDEFEPEDGFDRAAWRAEFVQLARAVLDHGGISDRLVLVGDRPFTFEELDRPAATACPSLRRAPAGLSARHPRSPRCAQRK